MERKLTVTSTNFWRPAPILQLPPTLPLTLPPIKCHHNASRPPTSLALIPHWREGKHHLATLCGSFLVTDCDGSGIDRLWAASNYSDHCCNHTKHCLCLQKLNHISTSLYFHHKRPLPDVPLVILGLLLHFIAAFIAIIGTFSP